MASCNLAPLILPVKPGQLRNACSSDSISFCCPSYPLEKAVIIKGMSVERGCTTF